MHTAYWIKSLDTMSPVPIEIDVKATGNQQTVSTPLDAEDVVISGMSAVMPGCQNMMEFAEKLYDKVNIAASGSPRWKCNHPDASQHCGTIPNLDRFDAQFFMVYYKLSHDMDAMAKKLLEHSYQAIFDAGISPMELSGQSVGVYVTSGFSEMEKASSISALYRGITGCNRAMYANRISYYLNLKGPSMFLESDSCSLIALEQAYQAIQSGQCDSALVGGARLLLHPHYTIQYNRLVSANADGKTKCYDMNADGHALSEAVNVIFLQKAKNAKRIYASVRHVKNVASTGKGIGKSYSFYREPEVTNQFLREFYMEANTSPSLVEYVEGFGAAICDADKAELQSIEEVFCKDKMDPLLVGSVMSNVGFTDAASGTTAIIKLLLAYQSGKLAANINCDYPRNDLQALIDGRMRILTDHHGFNRSYTAVNNFSITGLNGHALLKGHYKPKNISQYHSEIPHLLMVSGRQEFSVQKILNDIKGRPLDPEEIGLLQNIHKTRIPKHLSRGYGIYTTDENNSTVTLGEQVNYYDDARKPLWFVYSGMGSQWSGMGIHLMRIPIFADAIKRCQQVLEPKGVDVIHIITSSDQKIFDNILNSFVGIAAIQIGLTDILHAVGLVPDNIIGHSVGELGCAYGDGCLTAEEMILMAYSRGLVSAQTPFIKGSMAAVGIGYKQISKLVPPEIEVACHNGPTSSTISGPAEIMQEFVASLTAQGIFAKEVACSNIAYHSRYIADAGPKLFEYLKEVVNTPKLRSERWLSTSVPQDKWNKPAAMYSSAEYHTNNLLSPVLFEETLRLVPHNAVLVEIAPHSLLQAILKRSLSKECHYIPLTSRESKDNAFLLLEAIGKLYMEGYNVDISALYPKIEFPVSTETRMLSHLVEWVYAEKWKVCKYMNAERIHNAVYKPIISVFDEEYQYLNGNMIEGRKVFPFAGSLVFVWDTLAMIVGKPRDQFSIQFKDVTFHTQPPLHNQRTLNLTITIQRGSGRFEITYDQGLVVDGIVAIIANFANQAAHVSDEQNDSLDLTSADIYRFLYDRGYQYRGAFRSIHKVNMSLNQFQLEWNNNWVTFLDGALQMNALRRTHEGISQPRYIKRICIDVRKHFQERTSMRSGFMDGKIDETHGSIRCGGVIIEHINFNDRPIVTRQSSALKTLTFFPFIQNDNNDNPNLTPCVPTTLYVYLQIVSENLNKNKLNILYISKYNKTCVLDEVINLLNSPPEIKVNIIRINHDEILVSKCMKKNPDVVFLHDLISDEKVFEALHQILVPDTFVINLGIETEDMYPTDLLRKVCSTGKGQTRLELARWKPSKYTHSTAAVSIRTNTDLKFLCETRSQISAQHKLLILAPYPPPSGLKELVKQWRSEVKNNQIYLAMINHKYSFDDDMEYASFELAFNILDHGSWGGEYYIPSHEDNDTGRMVTLRSLQLGDLSSLHWIEAPKCTEPGIAITIHYAGLNVFDAKRAVSEISTKDPGSGFGMDFSGVTDRGERVMGLIRNGAACGRVLANPELLWPIPEHWNLEDAATVPLPYVFAFYCLSIKCRLVCGMNILVHGGAGSLGQAVISIALANGCKVFTTVSDIYKKRLLRKLFPDLAAEHIGNSRDVTFRDMVLNATKGEGCHIIISSVRSEQKQATLDCCAMSGTTLDVVQIHTQEPYSYGMFNMTKSRSYVPIDFSSIFEYQNTKELKKLQLLVSDGIVRGYVKPLPRVIYPPHEVSRAFRLLAASRHRGRVLINLQDQLPAIQPRIMGSPGSCHLILCDEEGFGIQIANRLVSRGARKLYLHCPRRYAYVDLKKQTWEKLGVIVHIFSNKLDGKKSIVNLLKDSSRLGPVEGLYVVVTGIADDGSILKANSTVTELDMTSREFCPSLRYFAIITKDNSIGHEVSVNRHRYGLPSTVLQLHNLEQFDYSKNPSDDLAPGDALSWTSTLDVLERALYIKKPIVLAYVKQEQTRSLLEEVSRISGVNMSSNSPDRTTLEQVGIDNGRALELCNLLEAKFNIILPKETVSQMTIAKLKKLQEDITEINEESSGFGAYFNYIDADELLANVDSILMRTLAQNFESRPDEFDNDLTYLCIIPGMEGHHNRFTVLCERLKIPAMVLQPGLDITDGTIQEMAHRLTNVMMKKLNMKTHFYLLGYEFGVIVALEMAEILESRGYTGTVYCLGGTPEEIRTYLDSRLGNATEDIVQDRLVQHMFTLMTREDSKELKPKLRQAKNWKEKVDAAVKLMRKIVPYSTQYIRALMNTAYARIKMTLNYESKTFQLQSNIVLLRTNLQYSGNADSSKAISAHKIAVHELNATLSYSTKDLRCAAIVNKYLQPEVLEEFHKINHCESSLVNDNMMEVSLMED